MLNKNSLFLNIELYFFSFLDEGSKSTANARAAPDSPPSTPLSFLRLPWPDSSCGLQQAKQTDKRPRRPALSPVPSFPSNPLRRDRREGGEPEPDLAALGIQKRRLKIPPSLVASINLTAAARAASFRSPRKSAILSLLSGSCPLRVSFLDPLVVGWKAASGLSVPVLDF